MLGDESEVAVPMGRVLSYELSLMGSHGMPSIDYASMLALVADGRLAPDRLVGRVIALDDAGAALVGMSAPPTGSGMTIVDMSRS